MDKRDKKRNTHRMGRYGYAGNATTRNYIGRSRADAIRLGYVGTNHVNVRRKRRIVTLPT